MPRTRTLTRGLLVAALPAALTAGLLVAPATADPRYPDTVALETGSRPEGIAAGPRDTFFAGARSDGAVYVGNAKNGQLRTFVPGRQGEIAGGMRYDAATARLWVAGGTTGDVTAYDARSGRALFTATVPGTRFLNDVAVTSEAVYVTDSRSNQLVRIPTPDRALPAPGTFELLTTTIPAPAPGAFGPNGIRVLPTGDLVVVSGGDLYAVDPASGAAEGIAELGRELTAGDGLVLDGRTLYVVYGFDRRDSVVEVEFDAAFTSVTFVRELTADGLDRPTTGALVAGALYVVNGRFGTLETQPDAPVYVSRLEL